MMSLGVFVAVLALCSVSEADPNCTELTSPLEEFFRKVIGKWILYAATTDSDKLFNKFQADNSSWMEISPSADDKNHNVHVEEREGGHCVVTDGVATFLADKIKLTLNSKPSGSNHIGNYLQTLDDDALVWSDETTYQKKKLSGKTLLLFTRNGTLDDDTWNRFNSQAKCLGFTKFHFLESTGLCPLKKDD